MRTQAPPPTGTPRAPEGAASLHALRLSEPEWRSLIAALGADPEVRALPAPATVIGRAAEGFYQLDYAGKRFTAQASETLRPGSLVRVARADPPAHAAASASAAGDVRVSDTARALSRLLGVQSAGTASAPVALALPQTFPGDAEELASALMRAITGCEPAPGRAVAQSAAAPAPEQPSLPAVAQPASEPAGSAARAQSAPPTATNAPTPSVADSVRAVIEAGGIDVARAAPAAGSSPAERQAAAIVDRQAAWLNGEVAFTFSAWPGQQAKLVVTRDEDARARPRASGAPAAVAHLELDLPRLGKVRADLRLHARGVAVSLRASGYAANTLRAETSALALQFMAAGLSGSSVYVDHADA